MNRLAPTGSLVDYCLMTSKRLSLPNLLLIHFFLLAICMPMSLSAQIELKTWELQNNLGNEPNGDPVYQADASAMGICATCGDVRRGGGINAPNSGRLHTIVSNNWDAVTLAEARSFAEYYKISIRPSVGYGIRLTSLALRLGRTTAGPNRFALFSNTNGDNFITQIGSTIEMPGTSLTDTLYFPDSLFANCTNGNSIDFRLYAWVDGGGQTQYDQAWIGNVGGGGAGNDIIISGYVESLPLAFTSTVFDTPHCYGETDNLLRRLQVGPNSLPGNNEEVVWRIIGFSPGAGSDLSAYVGGEFTSADNNNTNSEFQIFNSGRSFRPVSEPMGQGNIPLYGTYTLEVFVRNTLTGCVSEVYGPLAKEIKAKPQLVIPAFAPSTCSGATLIAGDFDGFSALNGQGLASMDVDIAAQPAGLTADVGPTTGAGLPMSAIDGDIFTNLTSSDLEMVYTITGYSDNGCAADPTDYAFRILAEPVMDSDLGASVCSQIPIGVQLGVDPILGYQSPTGYHILSINPEPGLNGAPGNAVTGPGQPFDAISNDIWENTTNGDLIVTYTVAAERLGPDNSACEGEPLDIELIIHAVPQIEILSFAGNPFDEVCVESEARFLASPPADGNGTYPAVQTYAWQFSGNPLVAGYGQTGQDGLTKRNQGATYPFADAGIQMVDLVVTYDNGCQVTSATHLIDVHPLPVMVCPDDISVCLNDPSFDLLLLAPEVQPFGGTFDGPGVSGSWFDPALAVPGVVPVTYSYTDGNTCSNDCAFQITVHDLPSNAFRPAGTVVTFPFNETLDFDDDHTICVDQVVEYGTMANTAGINSVSWAIDGGGSILQGQNARNVQIQWTTPGTWTLEFIVTNIATGCQVTNSLSVTVFENPAVQIDGDPYVCDNKTILLDGMPSLGEEPYTHQWTILPGNTGQVILNDLGDGSAEVSGGIPSGNATIEYLLTDVHGCTASSLFDVTVVNCSALNFNITDPCSCNNDQTSNGSQDGTFSETVAIPADPAGDPGQSWTVMAISKMAGAPGPQDPVGVIVGDQLMYSAMNDNYQVAFTHADDAGYEITVEGPNAPGSPGNITLMVNNICQYPVVSFVPAIDPTYCSNDPAQVLGVLEENGFSGMAFFNIDGNGPVNTLDPGSLNPGAHSVSGFFTGNFVNNEGGTVGLPAFPGCVTDLSSNFDILEAPVLFVPVFPPSICSDNSLGSKFPGFTAMNAIPFTTMDILSATVHPDLTPVFGPTIGNGLPPDAVINDRFTNLSNGGRTVVYSVVLQGDNGCASTPEDFTFRILAEPQVEPLLLERCSEEPLAANINLEAGSWGDVNGPPNLVQFNITINSNGLIPTAGNPTDGTCFSYTEIFDDAWLNTTSSTVEVIYTVTPVRSCGTPNECQGDPAEIVIHVAPELVLSAYTFGTNDPVDDPILICEDGVNANAVDVTFDLDSHIDVQPNEFMRYFWLGVLVDDPNGAGISNNTTLMGPDPVFPLSFNPGDPSVLSVSDDIGIGDPLALVEPVSLTYLFGGPVLIMANGKVCGNNDPANWLEIHAQIVPSPTLDFVYPGSPVDNNEQVCNASNSQVFITLNPEYPGLVEGVDYHFELHSIQYSLDGMNYLPGYGPLTGGGYVPSASGLVEETIPGIPGLMETLFHDKKTPVWVRYRFQTKSLDPSTNCDGEFKDLTMSIQPFPWIECPPDLTVQTSENGFGDCSADATWNHPIPAPACSPVELNMLTENGLQNVVPGESITYNFSGTGSHIVQYTASDAAGNQKTCEFKVDVADDEVPIPLCQQQLVVALNSSGEVSITVGMVDLGSFDNCTIDTITLDKMDFNCDDIGINIVNMVVTDASQNSATCQSQISVNDFSPPVPICINNLSLFLDEQGEANLLASQIDGGSYDNCGVESISVNPDVFTCKDKGENEVILTVKDFSQNSAFCISSVSIFDTIPPVLDCPQNITHILDPGECRTIVNYEVIATDNCPFPSGAPLIEQTGGQASGTVFERGVFINCFRVLDDSGNEATCCFTIEVLEYPYPTKTMVCNDLVQISLDEDCATEIGADLILEGGPYGCYEDYIVTIFSATNQPLASSPIVGAAQIGKTMTVKVMDPETGNSCWGAILIEDKMPPKLNCPIVEVNCGDPTGPDQIISPDPATSDNCDSWTALTFEDIIDNLGCAGGPYTRIINRNWIGVDDSGNKGYCTQQIKVIRPTLAILDQLENYDGTDQPAFDCSAGYPTTSLIPFPGGDGCGVLQPFYEDKVLSICSGSYTVLRTWTVLDMCLSKTESRIQTIKVLDQIPPVLTCPKEHDIQITKLEKNGYQDCTAKVLFPPIQVSDNCSVSSELNLYVIVHFPDGSQQLINAPNSNGQFEAQLPVGKTYEVSYVAIDACGNKNECSFTLDVKDVQGPVVVCETYHVVSLSDSVTLVIASAFDDGSWDVCTPVTFAARRMDNPQCAWNDETDFGPTIPFYCCDAIGGPIMVEMRVSDAYGNANSCMVEVQVVDKIKPNIWCPDDITVQCGMPYTPTELDTFNVCVTPTTKISGIVANTYVVPIDVTGIPGDAIITDLDLGLTIHHEYVNQLSVTLYSPMGKKATVLSQNGCPPPTKSWYPMDIQVTFNDEAYDLDYFNQTGEKIAAAFTCSPFIPSIGAYNQGQMMSQDDPLIAFDGQPLNSVTDTEQCFTVNSIDVDPGTNRLSNSAIGQLISNLALKIGDEIVLKYTNAKNGAMAGLVVGQPYLFKVINGSTLEFLDVLGVDLTSVTAGSTHQFCRTDTWLLVVRDHEILAGGTIDEVCLSIAFVTSTGLKPHATDNTEACGISLTWDDLGDPGQCADNTFINRRWKAADAFGNSASCIQRVYFKDDTPLLVQFPCDVTINCEDLDELNMTGEVVHNGDCEQIGIEISDQKLTVTDACYKILRTWTVKNNCSYQADGNVDYILNSVIPGTNTLVFTTTINALINSRNLQIGDPLVLRYVTSASTEIGGMTEGDMYQLIYRGGTSFEVSWNTTKQQSVTITSTGTGPHTFRYGNSSLGLKVDCHSLKDQSPLTQWLDGCPSPQGCTAWEDDGDGYFSYTQEIKVIDNDSPKLIECHVKEYCSFEEDCSTAPIELIGIALDNCTPQDQLIWTYLVDAFSDGSIDISGTGKNASGLYPLGSHTITWRVSDKCGNLSECSQVFIVKDCLKPSPICHAVSIDLMPTNGTAEVWATNLEVGESHDNCTEYENLTFLVERLSQLGISQVAPDGDAGQSILVSCDDLPPNAPDSIVEVVVWVGDEAGNWDYCITTIAVQDWMSACGGTMNAELTGYVADESGEPIELVEVDLTGNGNNMSMQTTGNSGAVSFGSIPTIGQYAITPQKDIYPLNGVSTYDLLLIQKHLLSIKSINSPYRLIAADVNNNCTISISDIIELRKMILAPGANFANNTSWRFVEAGYVFPNPAKPCNFMEVKSFNGLQSGMNTAAFIGVKTGDVSGDAQPNSLLGVESRNTAGALEFAIDEQHFVAGETVIFDVTAGNFEGIQGYQYTIGLDEQILDFVRIDAVWTDLSGTNFGQSRIHEGMITTSWNASEPISLSADEVLYRITVRTKTSGKLSEAITINSKVTRAEAYNQDEELLDVYFRFDNGIVTGGGFELYQNEPNPFGDMTRIGFNLPAANEAVLSVHDVTGKVVYRTRGDFNRGYNEFVLRGSDVPVQGMLYYTIQCGEYIATKRMTMQE